VSCSWFYRRVLFALLLAAACLAVGGTRNAVLAATPSVRPPAGPADPTRPRASTSEPASTTTVTVRRYTVRPGDTLTAIATQHRYPGGWSRLYAHNRSTVGPDPNLIFPGQTLRLRSSQPNHRPAPRPRRPAVTKAPASSHAQPVQAGTQSEPTTPAAPVQPTRSQPKAQPELLQPALVILLAVSLLLATFTAPRLRGRRRRLVPVVQRRPVPDPTLAPRPHPRPASGAPSRPAPTPANGDDQVSFSLVVMADGNREAELEASLAQLATLDRQRLGIVVVVGEDDPRARRAVETVRRRVPDRFSVVTDRHRPGNVATAVDRALPACQGEVTGVLGPGAIPPDLLDRVAGHVRQDGATMVWADPSSRSCSWSSSRAPARFRLRLVPAHGQSVFVRTQLLRAQTVGETQPATGPGGRRTTAQTQPTDARRRGVTVQLRAIADQATPDDQLPGRGRRRPTVADMTLQGDDARRHLPSFGEVRPGSGPARGWPRRRWSRRPRH
jgi:LysM repeat protein